MVEVYPSYDGLPMSGPLPEQKKEQVTEKSDHIHKTKPTDTQLPTAKTNRS